MTAFGATVTNFFVNDVAITTTTGGPGSAPTDLPRLFLRATTGGTAVGGSSDGTLYLESNGTSEPLISLPLSLNATLPPDARLRPSPRPQQTDTRLIGW